MDSEAARGIGCGSGWAVAQRQNSRNFLAAHGLHHGVRGLLRRFEMHGDGLVAPGVLELTTAIGDINELYAQLAGRVFKTAGLVAEFRGEKQQALGCAIRFVRRWGQGLSTQTNDSVWGKDSLALANGANWSRVGSAQQYQGSFR